MTDRIDSSRREKKEKKDLREMELTKEDIVDLEKKEWGNVKDLIFETD